MTQKKQTTQNTAKQNYSGSVACYDIRPGKEMGLFYNAPEPIWDKAGVMQICTSVSSLLQYFYTVGWVF